MKFNYKASVLNEAHRLESINALKDRSQENPLDLLIVGGGVVGLGSALDAASRGFSVGLIEKDDFASGTSSKSSRLAHGGLRYLEHFEFALVHEALRERGLLIDVIAPNLTHSVEFIFPTTSRVRNLYNRFGVEIYYWLSKFGAYGGVLPRPTTKWKSKFIREFSTLDTTKYHRAVTYFDAQIDDARHTLALARTASGYGAHVVSYAQFINYEEFESTGLIRVQIESDDSRFDVITKSVLFATGPWTNEVIPDHQASVVASKGAHIIVPRSAINLNKALISRTDSSVLFILPWENEWIIGTTDNAYDGKLDALEVADEDVEFLLKEANAVLSKKIVKADIVGSYVGIRPLASPKQTTNTAKASREHRVDEVAKRIFSIVGGKYTTYRVMARDAIDQISIAIEGSIRPCQTKSIPLVGAKRADAGNGFESTSLLLNHYGEELATIRSMIEADPSLGELVHSKLPYILAEIHFAVLYQGARTVDDVITRRLRLNEPDSQILNQFRLEISNVIKLLTM
jgi:glycerol-3-phosphate dehydrogenase